MARIALLVALSLSVMAAGCGGDSTTSGLSTTSLNGAAGPLQATAADLTLCVQETNRYRAQAGKALLTQSATLEHYAATGAQVDATVKVTHSHIASTRGGGVATAENEVLATAVNIFGTIPEAIRRSIAEFYAEGPSGGHYQNLEGPYRQVGCGVFIGSGLITFVQDFH